MTALRLAIVGECLSAKDEGEAFRDGNGRFFRALLHRTGIEAKHAEFLNIFPVVPPLGAGPGAFFGPKGLGVPHTSPFRKGKYILPKYFQHVTEACCVVDALQANLVLAVGEAALWALTSERNMTEARGRITSGKGDLRNQKILPCLSPQSIQSDYSQFPILLADLAKAKREMEFPETHRPSHEIWLSPSIEDIAVFYHRHLRDAEDISTDIETKPGGHITCIGFSPTPAHSITIPFFSNAAPGNNYWSTPEEEVQAWQWVRRILASRPCYGQNFQYDMAYLWRYMGIPTPQACDDTMLLHHALQPEMRKGLGFLASLHTDEPAWKFMHKQRSADRSVKKEN